VAAGHSGQFTPMRLPVNTVIHTTLVGHEPATFPSLVRRATSSATEPTDFNIRIKLPKLNRSSTGADEGIGVLCFRKSALTLAYLLSIWSSVQDPPDIESIPEAKCQRGFAVRTGAQVKMQM